MRLRSRIGAFLLLRCPNCQQGRLFGSWFRMNERCSYCGLAFYRESGYYVGSIYINYAGTVAVLAVAFLLFFRAVPEQFELMFFLLVALVSSLVLFRHSRSLWIAIDYWISPWKPAEPTSDVPSVNSH